MHPHETPQSPRAPRRDGWTPARREQFLQHLAAGLHVKRACALVGMSRPKAYALRGRDAGFARGWDEARRAARTNREAAYFALLPEKLRRTLSDMSTACHLQPAHSDLRTVSDVSTACHLARAANGARHGRGRWR